MKEDYRGTSSVIIEDIKVESNRSSWSYVFSMRRGRQKLEAHHLARAVASLSPGRYVWLLDTPEINILERV